MLDRSMLPGTLFTSTETGIATVTPGADVEATVTIPEYVPDAFGPSSEGVAQITTG